MCVALTQNMFVWIQIQQRKKKNPGVRVCVKRKASQYIPQCFYVLFFFLFFSFSRYNFEIRYICCCCMYAFQVDFVYWMEI